MIAVRDPDGRERGPRGPREATTARRHLIRDSPPSRAADPDVIENHNLHGFDLPFLDRRARMLGVPLALRDARAGPGCVSAPRDARLADGRRRVGACDSLAPGRELIDTHGRGAALRFLAAICPATASRPSRGTSASRARSVSTFPGARSTSYRRDPERVRRYATDDVVEVAALARMLGGAAFALAQMAPRRYERLADAGAATGVLDPLLVRAYMRESSGAPRASSRTTARLTAARRSISSRRASRTAS